MRLPHEAVPADQSLAFEVPTVYSRFRSPDAQVEVQPGESLFAVAQRVIGAGERPEDLFDIIDGKYVFEPDRDLIDNYFDVPMTAERVKLECVMFSSAVEGLWTEVLELQTNVTRAAAIGALSKTPSLATGVLEGLRSGGEAVDSKEVYLNVTPPAAPSFTAVVRRNIIFRGKRSCYKFDDIHHDKLESEFDFPALEGELRVKWKDDIIPCGSASLLSVVPEGDAFVIDVPMLNPLLSCTVGPEKEKITRRVARCSSMDDFLKRDLNLDPSVQCL
jgi:hypothetical protein